MKKSVENIYKEIEALEKRIEKIQNKCRHENVLKEHHGNTGNWDPNDDCYWTDFHCPDCDKRWSEDGTK